MGLIQQGSLLSIDTPQAIIEQYPNRLMAVKSESIYRLINDLKNYNQTHSVYPFGEYLHYAPKEKSTGPDQLKSYLQEKGHENVEVNEIEAGIEDCFMELMSGHHKKETVS